MNNSYRALANQTVSKIRELIDIKNISYGDLPLLINRVTSKFARDCLQKKLNGERLSNIDIITLQKLLEGEKEEGSIVQYAVQELPGSDPIVEQYQVVIFPRVACKKILTTIEVRRNA